VKKTADESLPAEVPPSSPPTIFLLAMRVMTQSKAHEMKTTTLNPSAPAGT